MKLSAIKTQLEGLPQVNFLLPNGSQVPAHFHVTEVGQVSKKYIDCGGTLREESKVTFQLWEDGDVDHRLAASKLLNIIDLANLYSCPFIATDDLAEVVSPNQVKILGRMDHSQTRGCNLLLA